MRLLLVVTLLNYLKSGANISVIDDMSSGKAENLSEVDKDINLIIGDVRNPDVVSKEMKRVEIVFNLAACMAEEGILKPILLNA